MFSFECQRNLMPLTSLFKGSDMPTKVPRHQDWTTGALEQFWHDALPAATNDSYGFQRVLNPGMLAVSPSPLPLSHFCVFSFE